MAINRELMDATMAADIDNLIREHLRALRSDVSDVKERLEQVEMDLATLAQEVDALAVVVEASQFRPEG